MDGASLDLAIQAAAAFGGAVASSWGFRQRLDALGREVHELARKVRDVSDELAQLRASQRASGAAVVRPS